MTTSKNLYSIPKTQPTLSSSSKDRIKTHKQIQYTIINTCSQVSAFSTDDREQMYTHNMKIDYGKISKPFEEQLKKSIKKQVELSADLRILLSTKKFKNLKQYTLSETEREGIDPPLHTLLTQKKALSTQRLGKAINPESGNKIHSNQLKKKNRIISVKAYQTTNISLREDGSKIEQFDKIEIRKSQAKQKEVDYLRTDRSDRKISHSRIIRTFNPTAGLQTKIITYPDLSEVFKLRESRRK